MSLRLQNRRTSQGHFPVTDRVQSRYCSLESRSLFLCYVSVSLSTTENAQETMKSWKVLRIDSSFNLTSIRGKQELIFNLTSIRGEQELIFFSTFAVRKHIKNMLSRNNTLDFLPFYQSHKIMCSHHRLVRRLLS